MKYEVLVTRDATESAVIEVEADSKDAAARAAVETANSEAVGWEINDNIASDAYLGSGVEDDVTDEGEQAVIR